MDTADLIRTARYEAALSQRVLAERAGVTQSMLSHYERGARLPSIPTLRTILAAAGKQVRAELEPLDQDIRDAINEVRAQPIDERAAARTWSGIDDLDQVDHRVEGLAAASLLGAPVPVDGIDIGLADSPSSYDWLAAKLNSWAFRFRAPEWEAARPLVGCDADCVRETIAGHCADGAFVLTTAFYVARMTLRPAPAVAAHVLVATASSTIPVQPLHEIDADDPYTKRVLAVVRGETPGADAAAPGIARRRHRGAVPQGGTRPLQYDPLEDRFY